MEVSQEIWNEGRTAFAKGSLERDCPYDMQTQWGDWADWICGYGSAVHEKITADMHRDARELLKGRQKKFAV